MHLLTAIRAFFALLFNAHLALQVQRLLKGDTSVIVEAAPTVKSPPKPVDVSVPAPVPAPKKPTQSEAITLLATLQREARLVDFLKEDLSAYSDEQVGAAVREIHRGSGAVLDRLFAIRPIVSESEGAAVEVPAGFDASRYRMTGNLSGSAPFKGTLCHHGWEAAKCELPEFIGSELAARTISPAEVEIR